MRSFGPRGFLNGRVLDGDNKQGCVILAGGRCASDDLSEAIYESTRHRLFPPLFASFFLSITPTEIF